MTYVPKFKNKNRSPATTPKTCWPFLASVPSQK